MIIIIDTFQELQKKRCPASNIIKEEFIETYLLKNLENEFNKYKSVINFQTAKNVKKTNTALIKKLENKLLKLKDLYLDDLIDKDTYSKDYKKYSDDLKKLKSGPIEKPQRDFSHVEEILNSDYINIYNNLTRENKKRFWMSFIDKIYAEKGEIKEVTFL